MQYDPRALEGKLGNPDTEYIVVYPDNDIDIVGFTHELRALLTQYHRRGQGWTIGSNIEIHGMPLIDALDESTGAKRKSPGI